MLKFDCEIELNTETVEISSTLGTVEDVFEFPLQRSSKKNGVRNERKDVLTLDLSNN